MFCAKAGRPLRCDVLVLACRLTINCRHALGIDCDVARLLFQSGLEVLSMDLAVDGHYQFMSFMVRLPPWPALRTPVRTCRRRRHCLQEEAQPLAPAGALLGLFA